SSRAAVAAGTPGRTSWRPARAATTARATVPPPSWGGGCTRYPGPRAAPRGGCWATASRIRGGRSTSATTDRRLRPTGAVRRGRPGRPERRGRRPGAHAGRSGFAGAVGPDRGGEHHDVVLVADVAADPLTPAGDQPQ